ncbi:hypothetical protein HPB51_027041 [Rhipicephalus microplus]|uniref:Uncharacterized protein n=1 Tax=Rhipicephalus microplus TaxID=6941 RepID=A0A9J6D1A3_RHIMP|nr:hypothetical protein HPB51_027041 [Rhipicephalus microplus]
MNTSTRHIAIWCDIRNKATSVTTPERIKASHHPLLFSGSGGSMDSTCFKFLCSVLQIAACTGTCSVLDGLSFSSNVPSGPVNECFVSSSCGQVACSVTAKKLFGNRISWTESVCAWCDIRNKATSVTTPERIKASHRPLLFSGSGGSMDSTCFKFLCSVLQVSLKSNFKSYISGNYFLLLLPDPPADLMNMSFVLMNFLRMLLLLWGDVESNPGPEVEDMLRELLSGHTKIAQEITGLSSRVASFEERLTKIELSIASITDVAPRVSELEKAVADIREIVSKLDHKNDDLENRSRRNNLLIYGLTENSGKLQTSCWKR